jgi:hypothetical protein
MKKIDKTKELILEHLRKTPIVETACQKADVSRMSFYRYKKEDPEFAAKVDEAMSDGRMLVTDMAELQLISAVKDRNLTAILYWLKHHHPSYKTRIEIEGQLEVITEFSPEQKELIEKAMKLGQIMLDKK